METVHPTSQARAELELSPGLPCEGAARAGPGRQITVTRVICRGTGEREVWLEVRSSGEAPRAPRRSVSCGAIPHPPSAGRPGGSARRCVHPRHPCMPTVPPRALPPRMDEPSYSTLACTRQGNRTLLRDFPSECNSAARGGPSSSASGCQLRRPLARLLTVPTMTFPEPLLFTRSLGSSLLPVT